MSKLALHGGTPVLAKPLPAFYPSKMDEREISAVTRVINSQVLSGFIAADGEAFFGGPEVRRFEKLFAETFEVKHAVSCSSATAGLHMALTALKIGPGDEVIVTPYSMCASATTVLMNGAVPVFVDIEASSFCIDPVKIEEKITNKTKAIIVVNLFGGPADYSRIKSIASKHSLAIIEDNAQAAGGEFEGKKLGTIGDIGVFSLNVHKSINSGEGGVAVTNNDVLAKRLQLARNHGEVVADQMESLEDKIILGNNYRLTELQAAVAYEQLGRLSSHNEVRVRLANYLAKKLEGISGITLPQLIKDSKHVYYVFPIRIDEQVLGISRDTLIAAMAAEGFTMSKGYVKPIYLLPIFQEKKVFNDTNIPFEGHEVSYDKGICPVVERMYEKEFTFTSVCQYPHTEKEVDLFVEAFMKVIDNKKSLS